MYSLISLATVLSLSSRVFADCYFPNGDVSGSDTACNPNALVSACCYDNQACLSNGLCVSDPHNATLARFHRGTCTDKAWKSGNCPRECLSINNNGVPVYSCNQTNTDSYCCFDNCKCNNNNFETFSFSDTDVYTVTIIGESFTQTHTSSSSATSRSASSATTTTASTDPSSAAITSASATSAPTPGPSSDNSSHTTAIGVGVGVGVGGALLIGAAAFFFFWRRKKSNDAEKNAYAGSKNVAEMDNMSGEHGLPPLKYAHHADDSIPLAHLTELPSTSPPVELPASPTFNQKVAK